MHAWAVDTLHSICIVVICTSRRFAQNSSSVMSFTTFRRAEIAHCRIGENALYTQIAVATISAGSVVWFKSKLVYVSLNSILFSSFFLSVASFYAIFIFLLLPQPLQYNRFFMSLLILYGIWCHLHQSIAYGRTTISRFSNDDAVEYFTPFPHTHTHTCIAICFYKFATHSHHVHAHRSIRLDGRLSKFKIGKSLAFGFLHAEFYAALPTLLLLLLLHTFFIVSF